MRDDRYRMGFHLMPPKGWLNDPNGLCQFGGEYHVFFQYSPESPLGGQKYWGHYISGDLLHWRFAGTALSPDREFDRSGVYSGSAIVTAEPDTEPALEPGGERGRQPYLRPGGHPAKHKRMRLYYTGNVKLDGDYDYINSGREANVIYTDSSDGIHFSEKKLLLTNADYPSDYTCHVRDPKVYFENEMYHMVLGGRKRAAEEHCGERKDGGAGADCGTGADRGAVILYRSVDGMDWELEREIETEEPFGYMWECPDIFPVGSRTCFSFCPQGLEAEPMRYQNTDQSGYVWMEHAEAGQIAGNFTEWDMGFEFYAPQTFEDERGRRILMGWVGLPVTPYANPTVENGWQHCLTVPRELTVRNGVVCQNPVQELECLKEHEQTWWSDGCVENADFSFWLETKAMETESWSLSLGEHLFLKYENKVFTWEFPDGKTEAEDWGRGRRVRRMELEKLTDIRILCDHSVLELFVNGGSRVMCGRFYPSLSDAEAGCSIRIEGCGARAVTHFWHMKAMEVADDETVVGDWRGTD